LITACSTGDDSAGGAIGQEASNFPLP